MYYPGKDNEHATGSLIEDWGGLNRQYHIAENEWADMLNMSSRRFPLACPRERRTLLKEWGRVKLHINGSKFLYATAKSDISLSVIMNGKGYNRATVNAEIPAGYKTTADDFKKSNPRVKGDWYFKKNGDGTCTVYNYNTWTALKSEWGIYAGEWQKQYYEIAYVLYNGKYVMLPYSEKNVDINFKLVSGKKEKKFYYIYSDTEPLPTENIYERYPEITNKLYWIELEKFDGNNYITNYRIKGIHKGSTTVSLQEKFDWTTDYHVVSDRDYVNHEDLFKHFADDEGNCHVQMRRGDKYTELPFSKSLVSGFEVNTGTATTTINYVYLNSREVEDIENTKNATVKISYTNKKSKRQIDYVMYKNPETEEWEFYYTSADTNKYHFVVQKQYNVLIMDKNNTYQRFDNQYFRFGEPDENVTGHKIMIGETSIIIKDPNDPTKDINNPEFYVDASRYSNVQQLYCKGSGGLIDKYKTIISTENYSVYFTDKYDSSTERTIKMTRHNPTGFTCQGAWILSYTRYDGTRRFAVCNNAFDTEFSGYNVGNVGADVFGDSNVWTSIEGTEDPEKIESYEELIAQDTETRRQIVCMGAKVVLFPEKYYMNIFDRKDRGWLENLRYPLWQDGYCDSDKILVTPCTLDGEAYDTNAISKTAPEKPANGQVWIDISGKTPAYKIWDASSKMWNPQGTTYLKIQCKGAFKGFKQWDTIKISGFDKTCITKFNKKLILNFMNQENTNTVLDKQKNLMYRASVMILGASEGEYDADYIKDAVNEQINAQIKEILGEYDSNLDSQIEKLNTEGISIYQCTNNYIVVPGILDAAIEFKPYELSTDDVDGGVIGKFAFERKVPDLDFYFECNNRIWGCKQGLNEDGQVVNEIRACKQGDPTNWNTYLGVSTDSYALTVGSDGAFTGGINFNGYPTFFKQKYMYKIYGNYPANYQLIQSSIRGVGRGLYESMVICNDLLYYATPNEFVVYDGSRVYTISEKLGKLDIKNVIAGTDMKRVYFVVTDSKDKKTLYVYDTDSGLWHIESCGDILFLANDTNILLYIEKFYDEYEGCYRYRTKSMSEDYDTIWFDGNWDTFTAGHPGFSGGEEYEYINSDGEKVKTTYPMYEEPFGWYAETGDMGFSDMSGKYIQKISVRAKVEKGAYYNVLISYDGREFEPITPTSNKEGISTRDFVFRIHRCDYFRLKFVGKGDVTLLGIYKTYVQGSDKH